VGRGMGAKGGGDVQRAAAQWRAVSAAGVRAPRGQAR
jgi:hypothetical protein